MKGRSVVVLILGALFLASALYFFFFTEHSEGLILEGIVDANQVVVSPNGNYARQASILLGNNAIVREYQLIHMSRVDIYNAAYCSIVVHAPHPVHLR